MSGFTALFDACVLYPAPLRDLLMRLAQTGLFRARWTEQIHDEWINALLRTRPELASKLPGTRQKMNEAVNDCLVTGYEPLIDGLTLPDPDDRHVLAAAIRGRADVIVTLNLADFPEQELDRFGIEPQHPDEFITHLIDLHAGAVIDAVRRQRRALKNPPYSVDELLECLRKQQLTETVLRLREFDASL